MDRRRFVRAGLGATVGFGLASAGCSALPLVGSDSGPPSYTNWLHAPGEIQDTDHYATNVIKPGTVLANEEAFDEREVAETADRFDDPLRPTGVDTEAVQQFVSTAVAGVYTGDVPTAEVRDALESGEYTEQSQVEDATLYQDDDDLHVWAVRPDALVHVIGREAMDQTRTVLETEAGSVNRYVDESETMARLTETLDDGYFVHARTRHKVGRHQPMIGLLENMVGRGNSSALDGSSVTVKTVFAYEEPGEVDTDALREYVEMNDGWSNIEDITYKSAGRMGIINGRLDAATANL